MAGKFVLKSTEGDKFRFNLCAGNGQVILTSQAYESKRAAQSGIASVGKNCTDRKCIERKEAKNGKPYFTLKATNGQVIGQSQMYASNAAMEKGIRSVAVNGNSRVDDRT